MGSLPLDAPGKPTMAPKPAADALLGVGAQEKYITHHPWLPVSDDS